MKLLQRRVFKEIYPQVVIAGVVYCISIWGNHATANLNKIERIHHKAAKLIYGVKSYDDARGS